jgi:GAF domain-containing protein
VKVEFSSIEPYSAITERSLLQSVVAVTRHVYGAAASSVFMMNPDTGELVFAAVAGAGEESLIGTRIQAGTGIVGWVAASCQTIVADDVTENAEFAKDVAVSTGYVPTTIMAAPLVADGECIGVLEVLDRHTDPLGEPSRELDDMELLGLLATQAALSLALLRRQQHGTPERLRMGPLLARLSEHAARESHDPTAVALLGICLDLLERPASTATSPG